MYERAKFADSCRTSASMNAVSRESFTPATAADAVNPVCLCVRRLQTVTPQQPTRMLMTVPSILWLAASPTRKSARCTASCPPRPPPDYWLYIPDRNACASLFSHLRQPGSFKPNLTSRRRTWQHSILQMGERIEIYEKYLSFTSKIRASDLY